MKLHDAMRKTVREYGVRVISEKRLIFILADLRAFEEYPAVKPVLEAIVSGDTGKELVRLFLEEDRDWFLSYAGNLRKSLSVKNHFREDLADYAADSLLYGLGLRESVTEPTDHGFDPAEHGRSAGNQDTGGRKELREKEEKARTEEKNSGGAKECGAGATRREHSGEKIQEPYGSRQEASGSVSAAPLHAGTKDYSKGMKLVIAAVLLAGGFAWGLLVTGSSHEQKAKAEAEAERNARAEAEAERNARAEAEAERNARADAEATARYDAGGVSVFGRPVYLRSEMNVCPWYVHGNQCLVRKVGDRVYMATAYMKAAQAPYFFGFGDVKWTPGTGFGCPFESRPCVYDYEKGTPIRLRSNSVFSYVSSGADAIIVTPPHDGKYDFYLDLSGDVPVTYVREHR